MTADTPGAGRLSVLITFAGTPTPATSSRVASKIELAGSTVRSRNLAVPLRLLFLAVGAVVAPGEGDLFAQPASVIKSMNPSSVHDAARHALWVALFFHAVRSSWFGIEIFNPKIEKSCLKKRFQWAAFDCGPTTRQKRWQV